MSTTSLDIQRLRIEQDMEGVPSCGWCGNYSANSELFDCDTCSIGEHHACWGCRTRKDSPCKDWEECMECGEFLTEPAPEFLCNICFAAEQSRIDERTCGACLRVFDEPLPLIGYCSLTCWAMERGEL